MGTLLSFRPRNYRISRLIDSKLVGVWLPTRLQLLTPAERSTRWVLRFASDGSEVPTSNCSEYLHCTNLIVDIARYFLLISLRTACLAHMCAATLPVPSLVDIVDINQDLGFNISQHALLWL